MLTIGFQSPKRAIPSIFLLLMACLLLPLQVNAQAGDEITVSGQITDETGETLIGANILIKGTSTGTITDFDGNYQLSVSPNDTLVISYTGYQGQIIPVGGRSEINIELATDVTGLAEVVVVGYGTVKRANLVGSVASLSSDEIEDIPSINLTSLLDGRMPGVSVAPAQPTGNPGAQPECAFGQRLLLELPVEEQKILLHFIL